MSGKSRVGLIVLLAILALIAVIVSLRLGETARERAAMKKAVKAKESMAVEVCRVERENLTLQIRLTGNIVAKTETTVFSLVPGLIESLRVEVGDEVSKGQLLADIDRKKARLAAQRVRAALKQARTMLANAKVNWERIKRLYEQKAVAEKLYDDARTGYEAAQAGVEQAESAVGLAENQLQDTRLVAPISGTVTRKFVESGDMMVATSMMKNSPLVTISDLDHLKVITEIPEKEISLVRVGMDAEITVDAYPGHLFVGKVTKIHPVVNPMSRTTQMEIELDNKPIELDAVEGGKRRIERPLRPGMFARIGLETSTIKDALVIPFDSVLGADTGTPRVVVVDQDEIVHIKTIGVGRRAGERMELLSGLTEGERIVVIGQQWLKEGDKVRAFESGVK